jgi:hypothetical protein
LNASKKREATAVTARCSADDTGWLILVEPTLATGPFV